MKEPCDFSNDCKHKIRKNEAMMVKRVLSLVLVWTMCLPLCACGGKGNDVIAKDAADYRFTLNKLKLRFCDDGEGFTVSGAQATTHDWSLSNYYNRTITAELAEDNKVTGVTMEYTDLDTKVYRSAEEVKMFLEGNTGKLSVMHFFYLMPLDNLKDMLKIVGATESELTVEMMYDLVKNGTPFEKNNWTVLFEVGTDRITITAEYETAEG